MAKAARKKGGGAKKAGGKAKGGKKGKGPMSKSVVLVSVADSVGVKKSIVSSVLGALTAVGHAALKSKGVFILPGWAKFTVKKTKAKPKRRGINPFTKEEMWFKAKPASKTVRARSVKLCKDCVA
jgi:nucleoid DNA-binding protein